MEASDTDERKLCSGCHTFWGTKATDFMCSTCFKKQGGEMPKPAQQVTTDNSSKTEEVKDEKIATIAAAAAADPAEPPADDSKVQVSKLKLLKQLTNILCYIERYKQVLGMQEESRTGEDSMQVWICLLPQT